MFRGTAVRSLLTLLGAALLAFQLFTPTGTFAPAHTFRQALTKAQTGITTSALPVREGTDKVRAPSCPGDPLGAPHVRDRQRCPASCCCQERGPISGRTAGADPSAPSEVRHRPTPRASRAHTPAALQVFRC
ncbi:hypothetical protein [Streptomyces cyanogenus]|uniref:Secreted protein n=1 Tax=Streptomyces cyanogenus TaxID=80860 RepID=A0ABX7U210_STRCY|nr:hypothetical protein [Streptomyces cyanogenus]QTE01657.1 hypothetical protein S1361_30285 [Streptomyces cyanogenus]